MKELNPKRKKFCRLLANGETGAGAYRKAYKNKNNNTCKRNAHRLLQQPAVLVYLSLTAGPVVKEEEKDKTETQPFVIQTIYGKQMEAKRAAAEKLNEKEKEKQAAFNYSAEEEMSTGECKVILSRIARGALAYPRYIVCKGEVIEKEVPPTFAQRKSCIAELNRMRGIYQKALIETETAVENILIVPV